MLLCLYAIDWWAVFDPVIFSANMPEITDGTFQEEHFNQHQLNAGLIAPFFNS